MYLPPPTLPNDKRRAESVEMKTQFRKTIRYGTLLSISAQSALRRHRACSMPRCCRFVECPAPAVPVTFNYLWAPCFNVLHSGSVFMCVFQLSPWQSKYPQVATVIPVGSVYVCICVHVKECTFSMTHHGSFIRRLAEGFSLRIRRLALSRSGCVRGWAHIYPLAHTFHLLTSIASLISSF